MILGRGYKHPVYSLQSRSLETNPAKQQDNKATKPKKETSKLSDIVKDMTKEEFELFIQELANTRNN